MTHFWGQVEVCLTGLSRKLLSRKKKTGLLLLLDATLCVISVWIAFSLRLGVWDLWSPSVALAIAASLVVWLPIFLIMGVYRAVVRFVGARAMWGIATSCILMTLVLSTILIIGAVPGVPRTIGVLQPMIFAGLLVISRLFARYVLLDLPTQRSFDGSSRRVLIFGAGSAGRQLALSLTHEPGMLLVGYIDDDERLAGQHLDGVKVYYSRNVGELVDQLAIDTVLLAVPQVSHQHRKEIVRRFADVPVHVLTLPAIADLVDRSVSIENLREIEITDLLGRDPVPPNQLLLHKTIADRVVNR